MTENHPAPNEMRKLTAEEAVVARDMAQHLPPEELERASRKQLPFSQEEFNKRFAEIQQHQTKGELRDADRKMAKLLAEVPDHPSVLHLAGIIAYQRNRPIEGFELVERSVQLEPNNYIFLRNMAEFYKSASKLDDALESARRAVELNAYDHISQFNLGMIHYERREYKQAIAAFRRSIELKPNWAEPKFALGETELMRGNWEKGWKFYEYRTEVGQAKNSLKFAAPLWEGQPLKEGERLLVHCDQGFGDCIQFSRFLPWLSQLAPENQLLVAPELHDLFKNIPGVKDAVFQMNDIKEYQYYIAISGLPRLYKMTHQNVPDPIAFSTDSEKYRQWLENMKTAEIDRRKLNIGIAWAGRPSHKNDKKRSMLFETLRPLCDLEGNFFSFQKGAQQIQLSGYDGKNRIIDCAPAINTFSDTVVLLHTMDVIVTVDTSLAHLAGAQGIPCLLMLPYACDWRWQHDTRYSLWYPSIIIIRQKEHGNWDSVIDEVKYLLETKIDEKKSLYDDEDEDSGSKEAESNHPQDVQHYEIDEKGDAVPVESVTPADDRDDREMPVDERQYPDSKPIPASIDEGAAKIDVLPVEDDAQRAASIDAARAKLQEEVRREFGIPPMSKEATPEEDDPEDGEPERIRAREIVPKPGEYFTEG